MGVIAYKNNLIFFHIAKCAGTSIEQFFNNISPNELLHPHISKKQNLPKKDYALWEIIETNSLQNNIPKVAENAFVISCVRNTYDQVVSHYFYNIKRGVFSSEYTFAEYVNAMYYGEKFEHDLIHMQQLQIINHACEKIRADFILYFCSLKKDMQTLCNHLNKQAGKVIYDPMKFAAKYHVNKTNHHLYKKYYTDNLKSKVYAMFKNDVDYFGYDFEDQKKVQNVGFTEHWKYKNSL